MSTLKNIHDDHTEFLKLESLSRNTLYYFYHEGHTFMEIPHVKSKKKALF